MKNFADLALDVATSKGATYCDIRIIEKQTQNIETKNGKVGAVEENNELGFGIRVLAEGAWGFAASRDLSNSGLKKTSLEAVRIANASARVKKQNVVLAPTSRPYQDVWQTPVQKDPFKISLTQKIDLLLRIDGFLRKNPGVKIARGFMSFGKENKIFTSSEGTAVDQTIFFSSVGYEATAIEGDELQTRSYPNSFHGQYQTRGYELIDELPLLENAPRIAEEAVALLSASQCPVGKMDLILMGNQLYLQIHESIGHPIELDRVLGTEANYAGTSFLTPDKLRNLKYGSDLVNVVADATWKTSPFGMGSFAYDDEGVPAQRTDIIQNGQFVGYMTSRETAAQVGDPRSNGTMRADGWNRIPLIRMTNVNLLPGSWELDDLIADTGEGIVLETNRSWSIDDKRYQFQFGTEIGWLIKNGKKIGMVKNPTYSGITTEFWNSCDAICNEKYWDIWGVPNCGKGQPPQTAAVAHGCSPARFRNILIGKGYEK
jgi:TldD protein